MSFLAVYRFSGLLRFTVWKYIRYKSECPSKYLMYPSSAKSLIRQPG
jgi:hypothetical protein